MTTLSTLVITNRPQFIDWWTWNITKQTRLPDEVIVATNLAGDEKELDDFEDAVRHCLNKIKQVTVLRHKKRTSIGELRQSVLENSEGEIINYVDDDDWYHPWLFDDYMKKMTEKQLRLVGAPGHHRLILKDLILFEHGEIIDLIHLPFCAVEGELARKIKFAPISINEDIFWLHSISDFIQNARGATEIDFPIICVIHDHNTWNSVGKIAHELAIEMTAVPLPEKPPWGVGKEEWKTTHEKLKALRIRLGFLS